MQWRRSQGCAAKRHGATDGDGASTGRRNPDGTAMNVHEKFLEALRLEGFEGDLSRDASDLTVLATDNSIYQVTADAVAFPRTSEDLARICRLLARAEFAEVRLRPRGGGTGTNGQSLGRGLIVDCSRHMTGIIEINVAERWVRVQPGVIKDRLNAALAEHGLFFAPDLSTSSRATIGGMISTDACGQGSCLYGKTSNHVLDLSVVLFGGEVMKTRSIPSGEIGELKGRTGDIVRLLERIAREKADLIAERFPKLNRSLTGYDLAHIRQPDGGIDPKAVVCGAEGTLGLIAEARLNLLPIPRHSGQINVFYDDFQAALRDARTMVALGAAAVETVDGRVLALARADAIWRDVAAHFPDDQAEGVNLVEFTADTQAEVTQLLKTAQAKIVAGADGRRGFSIARDGEVERITEMRKKAVGLLGRTAGPRRPMPFVEDCAVPPERLEPFIREFRAILDAEGLSYGMFGHVDAGVLHVRPALDLTDPAQEPLIRRVTEKVERLARQHGGLLWGEHGKGVRSEFVPEVFGPLYPALQEIKRAFDPNDQFNPGKIASARDAPLMKIDGVALRGQADRQIDPALRQAYEGAVGCNGNGACFSQSHSEVMCPSYKATNDRRHSPKGRSALVREWLRQEGPAGKAAPDFEAAVKDALDGCLSCRACARACPVQVDVAAFRARFMESWYARHRRPVADHLLAWLEAVLPLAARFPALSNFFLDGPGSAALRGLGLAHLPALPPRSAQRALSASSGHARRSPGKTVVIVPDAFTRFFEPRLVADFAHIVAAFGYEPWILPFRPNGKPLHVLGRLRAFDKVAHRRSRELLALADEGFTLVGIEPAITLTYAEEYAAVTGRAVPVELPQEWLARNLEHAERLVGKVDGKRPRVTLMAHCTERTLRPGETAVWNRIFDAFGVESTLPRTGCCGMAGTWGHESRNSGLSREIFAQNWAPVLKSCDSEIVATGFSCRCQTAIQTGLSVRHPISVLRELLEEAAPQRGVQAT